MKPLSFLLSLILLVPFTAISVNADSQKAMTTATVAGITYAGYIPPPEPLSKVINQSTVVVVASLNDMPAETAPYDHKSKVWQAIDVSTVYTLKGAVPSSFKLWITSGWMHYIHLFPGMFLPGSKFIALIYKGSDGKWEPTSGLFSLLPISGPGETIEHPASGATLHQVVQLLLPATLKPVYKQITLSELRDTVDPSIPTVLMRQVNDPNLQDRDSILSILAANKCWEVIPQIADLEHQIFAKTGNPESLNVIRECTSPEAVRWLNPLAVDPDYYLRLNSVSTLYELANKTSIPYLLRCLDVPDKPDTLLHFQAYNILHRLIPGMGRPDSFDYYKDHQKEEKKELKLAWNRSLHTKR